MLVQHMGNVGTSLTWELQLLGNPFAGETGMSSDNREKRIR